MTIIWWKQRMKVGVVTLASVLVASGASATPLAPVTDIAGELEQPALERVQYRNPRELSRDRYRQYRGNGEPATGYALRPAARQGTYNSGLAAPDHWRRQPWQFGLGGGGQGR